MDQLKREAGIPSDGSCASSSTTRTTTTDAEVTAGQTRVRAGLLVRKKKEGQHSTLPQPEVEVISYIEKGLVGSGPMYRSLPTKRLGLNTTSTSAQVPFTTFRPFAPFVMYGRPRLARWR